MANGIHPKTIELLVEQVKEYKSRVEQGILNDPNTLIVVGDWPQTITRITSTESKEISLVEFCRELVFDIKLEGV